MNMSGVEEVSGTLKGVRSAEASPEVSQEVSGEVSLGEPTEVGKKLKKVIEHRFFRRFIYFTVFVACILLAADSEYADYSDTPGARDLINALDVVVTVIFTIEAILLILGKGVKPYFTSVRNVFQFFIVGACWADVIIEYGKIKVSRGDAIIGFLRAVRPLMVLSNQPDIQNILSCLLKATLSLTSIGALIIFLLLL